MSQSKSKKSVHQSKMMAPKVVVKGSVSSNGHPDDPFYGFYVQEVTNYLDLLPGMKVSNQTLVDALATGVNVIIKRK